MNKTELLALGLPEESIREFQKLYHRDLMKMARRMAEDPEREADKIRAAIIPVVNTIKSETALRAILATVTHHYLKDYRDANEKAAQGATNTQDGEMEQKSNELNYSDVSLSEEREERQE